MSSTRSAGGGLLSQPGATLGRPKGGVYAGVLAETFPNLNPLGRRRCRRQNSEKTEVILLPHLTAIPGHGLASDIDTFSSR